jgi:hypothetical protein
MPAPKHTAKEFAAIWQQARGHTSTIAKMLGITERNVFRRRPIVEQQLGIVLASGEDRTGRSFVKLPKIGVQRLADIKNATVIIAGDRHLWPGEKRNVADLALKEIIKTIQPRPKILCWNGDLFDLPTVSRHPSTGYSEFPSVADELEACQAYLAELEEVAPEDCSLVFCVGNHDNRFTVRLAQEAPEFVGIKGMDLFDHLPNWQPSWNLVINKRIFVTHWWHQGQMNAPLNNLLKSGADAFISNHLHQGQITSWTDFDQKVRWAVDTGCMADFDPTQVKFTHYTRGNPVRWKQGFCVLTVDEHGELLPPELVQVVNGKAYFRGKQVTPGVKLLKKKAA